MSARPQISGVTRGCQLIGGALLTGMLLTTASALVHAQAARTVRDGVFTDAQAARGATLYGQQCASCHGDKLEGVQGPPLTTDVFLGRWQAQPLSDLANKIRNTMPAGSPGSLTPQQVADLVAHLLKVGSFPSASKPSWRRTKQR